MFKNIRFICLLQVFCFSLKSLRQIFRLLSIPSVTSTTESIYTVLFHLAVHCAYIFYNSSCTFSSIYIYMPFSDCIKLRWTNSENILLQSHGAFAFKNNYMAGLSDWSAVLSRSPGSMIAQNGNVLSQYLYLQSLYYTGTTGLNSKRTPNDHRICKVQDAFDSICLLA